MIKVWVKTHMHLGESIHVTNWFYILFIENKGMAYGMSFIPKILLSSFRLVAVVALLWYMYARLLWHEHRLSFAVVMAMVIAGAAGNLIDCMFYGQWFEASSPFHVAQTVPFGYGYAPLMEGKVVDMFYFPLIVTTWPDWVPVYGGQEFIFFSPVFNFADSCISVAVALFILFFRKEMGEIFGSNPVAMAEEEKNNNEETHEA